MRNITPWTTLVALATLTSLAVPTQQASACGGFFCQQVPVDQAAENIVFAIDEEAGTVDVHVQITYEGAAEEFAWIVPVPAEPELFQSTQDLFDRLSPVTLPLWQATFEVEGNCGGGRGGGTMVTMDSAESAPEDDDGGFGDNGVSVVARQEVGPYDTVTLQANSADELLTWLQDNDYDLPDDLSPKLDPYIAGGNYFVALRLTKGNDAGDIAPLGMSYASTVAQIPLQLTAIAATPDMRLRPYVFSSARAVPDNYLHVRVNQLAIDWMGSGSNYPDVITRAANEAGGQAFATDFAGPTDDVAFTGLLNTPELADLDSVRQINDSVSLIDNLRGIGVPVSNATAAIYAQFIDVHDNAPDDLSYFQCMECFGVNTPTVDADEVIDALADTWLVPMQRADAMIEASSYLTRMTSSMSADEMTVDPLFVINPDMEDVPQVRTARIVTECGPGVGFDEAPRRLELPDGRFVYLPESAGNGDADLYAEELGDVGAINALFIENTGQSGPPEILTDRTADLDAALAKQEINSCGGCNGTGNSLAWLPLGGLGLLLTRRRRKHG